MKTFCAVSAVLLAVVGLAASQNELVSSLCLGCICEASSACDTTLGCDGTYCGPFRISRPFFTDTELTKEANFATSTYESCTIDPFCSAAAIRKYMARYQRDCDGDGRQTCVDFAMLHVLGPSCTDQQISDEIYLRRFQNCLDFFPDA